MSAVPRETGKPPTREKSHVAMPILSNSLL